MYQPHERREFDEVESSAGELQGFNDGEYSMSGEAFGSNESQAAEGVQVSGGIQQVIGDFEASSECELLTSNGSQALSNPPAKPLELLELSKDALDCICDYIASPGDQVACMYTCKALHNLMLPGLYEELLITLEHRVHEYSGSLLLKGNPGLQHIKILVMVDKPSVAVTRVHCCLPRQPLSSHFPRPIAELPLGRPSRSSSKHPKVVVAEAAESSTLGDSYRG